MPPRNASRLLLFVAFAALAICVPLLALRSTAAEAAPSVQSDAPGGTIVVSPTTLTNCRRCSVTVSNSSPNRNLLWVARSQANINISPGSGILRPHAQVNVAITIPASTSCPARATITFSGQNNSASVSWSCRAAPTPTPTATPMPSPTPTTTPSPTPSPSPTAMPSPTPTLSTATPTVSPTPTVSSGGGTGQQNNGNPPPSNGGGSSGGSALSILFACAGLLLGALAFLLYLIPPAHASLRTRLLSLIIPVSIARRLEQDH